MSKVLFAVVVVVLAQVAFGRIARDTNAASTTSTSWENTLDLANQTFAQFHESFLNLAGVKTDDELMTKAQEKFQGFESSLRDNFNKLTEEAKPLQGKAEELFKTFSAKVDGVMADLKAKNPELFNGDTTKLQETANSTLRTVVESTQKFRADLQKEGQEITPKLQDALKAIYDSSLKTVDELKTAAQNSLNTIQNKTN